MARTQIPAPIEPFLPDLDHADYRTRREAVKQLAKTRNPEAVPPLIRMLDDKTVAVRQNAIRALGEFKDPRAIAPLIGQLAHDACHVHRPAYEEVMKFGPAAIPDLLAALQARNRDVRGGAAAMLAELQAAEAVEPILACLDDSDPYVLMAACTALGALKDRRAIVPLRALVTRDPASIPSGPVRHCGVQGATHVRVAALNCLVVLGEAQALEQLLDGYMGRFSLTGLTYGLERRAIHGDEAARAMLDRLRTHPNPDVRQVVHAVLGENGAGSTPGSP